MSIIHKPVLLFCKLGYQYPLSPSEAEKKGNDKYLTKVLRCISSNFFLYVVKVELLYTTTQDKRKNQQK